MPSTNPPRPMPSHTRRESQQSCHREPRGTGAVLSARDRRRMAPVVRSRTTSAPKPVRKTGTRIPRIRRSPGTGRPLSSTDPGTGARAGVPGFGSMAGRSGAVRGGADSGANVLGAGGGPFCVSTVPCAAASPVPSTIATSHAPRAFALPRVLCPPLPCAMCPLPQRATTTVVSAPCIETAIAHTASVASKRRPSSVRPTGTGCRVSVRRGEIPDIACCRGSCSVDGRRSSS
jgi:hypothetical protein